MLSRQIAEAHGGSLMLENRDDRTGCRASLRLPLQAVAPSRFGPDRSRLGRRTADATNLAAEGRTPGSDGSGHEKR